MAEPRPHTLLRIAAPQMLSAEAAAPLWVGAALERAPWVVVRRAPHARGLPVGVRGWSRAQRWAAWLPAAEVREQLTPPQLAARCSWRAHPRAAECAAFAALEAVADLMDRAQLPWGPIGSVGFELASGLAVVHAASDLDLIVEAPRPLPRLKAQGLLAALARLALRSDVLLETPQGAVALAEFAASGGPFLLRSAGGPRFVEDPWAAAADAA